MPQFYPDGPAAVNLNAISDCGGLNVPPESAAEFDTPGMQGSMQQLLSENLGKFVIADFLVGVSSIVRRVGILYSVGRSFLVLYHEDYHTFQVCDIFSLKFVSFFPPGFEPSLEELLSGDYTSGILNPGGNLSGILNPEPRADAQGFSGRAAGRGFSANASAPSSMGPSIPSAGTAPAAGGGAAANRNSTVGGCRTLGQR